MNIFHKIENYVILRNSHLQYLRILQPTSKPEAIVLS